MKAKLTSFQAYMTNGQHASWTSQKYNKTYWKFLVEFDNGDKGIASSTSQTPKWKIGEEYTYEKDVKDFNGMQVTNIKSMKLAQQQGGGYHRNERDQKVIMNQVALIATNTVMTKIDEEYFNVYEQFRNWIYDKAFMRKEDPVTTQGVIKIAAEYYANAQAQTVKVSDVLNFANDLLTKVKDTQWEIPGTNTEQSQKQQTSQEQPSQQDNSPFII